jgi:hypothetical protein
VCSTTLEKPAYPTAQKGVKPISFTLETTGKWEVVSASKHNPGPKPRTGAGTFRLECTETLGGSLSIHIIHPDPPPPPPGLPKWTITGDGDWRLFAGDGDKQPLVTWAGSLTWAVDPSVEAVFIVK